MQKPAHVTIFPYRFGKGSEERDVHVSLADSYPILQDSLNRQGIACHWVEVVPEKHVYSSDKDEVGTRPGTIKNLEAVIETVSSLAEKVALSLLRDEHFLLTFGGDHTQGLGAVKGLLLGETVKALLSGQLRLAPHIAPSTVTALLSDFQKNMAEGDMRSLITCLNSLIESGVVPSADLAHFLNAFHVIWFDAHGDYNTRDTSPSGNAHGMAAAALTGVGDTLLTGIIGPWAKVPATHMHFIAVRDLDPGEERLMHTHGVHIHDMEEIYQFGLPKVVSTVLEIITIRSRKEAGREPAIHLSFDVDGMDARYVPGTGTPVGEGSARNSARGPTLLDTMEAFRGIAGRIRSMDVAEANYRLDLDPARVTLTSVMAVVESFFEG